MRLIAFVMGFVPIWLIEKAKMARILLSILYNRRMLGKKAACCGKDVCIITPLRLKGVEYFAIGDNYKLDFCGIMEAWDEHNGHNFKPRIFIGNNVSMGKHCHIGCINRIEVGDNVLIGSNVLIIDHSHGRSDEDAFLSPPNERTLYSKGGISIGANVWIGEKASILSGVTIGENSIIGANSVVTTNIPANCVACGNPAKVVKFVTKEKEEVTR